jgi:hypothetical protein
MKKLSFFAKTLFKHVCHSRYGEIFSGQWNGRTLFLALVSTENKGI